MTYDASHIEILEDLEHVRRRPEMYIGDTGQDGLHHLLKEVVDNAVDEHLDGHVGTIDVAVDVERNIARVWDDGRGIPVADHPKAGIPTLTAVFTKLHAGGKFGRGAYTSAVVGLHGIGVKAVNALSERMFVETVRPRKEGWTTGRGRMVYRQEFARGEPVDGIGSSTRKMKAGTLVQFRPDPDVFGDARLDPGRIATWLRETAYLCPGLRIRLRVRGSETVVFHARRGLLDLLDAVLGEAKPFHAPIHAKTDLFEVALAWTDELQGEHWKSYVNVSPTPEHGTHVLGVKKSVLRILNAESKVRHRGEDIRDGMMGIVHAFVPEPKFRGQTKTRLENPGLDDAVAELMDGVLRDFVLHNGHAVRTILSRAGRLRDARRKYAAERKAIKGTKVAKGAVGILPGELIEAPDCGPRERELFIVEGRSALGTVRDARVKKRIRGRDTHYQEVFPLRGKPINAVQRGGLEKALENKEIRNLVLALGTGAGEGFDIDRMRCRTVYLLMDADPDGAHIQALMLGFFARHMPDLIAEDRLRVVLNPLFMGVSKDRRVYGNTVEDVRSLLGRAALGKHRIQRFKGLGESNAEDLRTYAMDPRTRKVMRVGWDGEDDRRLVMTYMGSDAGARKEILQIVE